jgi:hypothetical protein
MGLNTRATEQGPRFVGMRARRVRSGAEAQDSDFSLCMAEAAQTTAGYIVREFSDA